MTVNPVEVGQIRQDPRKNSVFVVVLHPWQTVLQQSGWMASPADRLGCRTGQPARWFPDTTLETWALIDPATPTEPTP